MMELSDHSQDESWDEESDYDAPDDYYDEEDDQDLSKMEEEVRESIELGPQPDYIYNIKGEIIDIIYPAGHKLKETYH